MRSFLLYKVLNRIHPILGSEGNHPFYMGSSALSWPSVLHHQVSLFL